MEWDKNQVRGLAENLLEAAGLSDTIKSLARFGVGHTNETWSVTLTSGQRFVLRGYEWPHDAPDLDRLRKEAHLHARLAEHGVPVARILSSVDCADSAAVLMEYLPGELLGDLASRLPVPACTRAWWSCGAALRRAHEIRYPTGVHGVIVGNRVEPAVPNTWGHWMMYNLMHGARQLSERQAVALDVGELQALIEEVLPSLNDHEPCLLHNDPHPWNVLVVESADGWCCSGWLDWEYAWVGDPTWDLVRMDLWRMAPIGDTPASFWEGYGGRPIEPNRSVYEMSLCLWQATEGLDLPQDRRTETQRRSLEYVEQVDHHVDMLRALVTGGTSHG